MEKAAKTHHIEYAIQKMRKAVEAKAREKAKKKRLIKEKDKRK